MIDGVVVIRTSRECFTCGRFFDEFIEAMTKFRVFLKPAEKLFAVKFPRHMNSADLADDTKPSRHVHDAVCISDAHFGLLMTKLEHRHKLHAVQI